MSMCKGNNSRETNTKDKHWALLGLTSLNGDPVMYVIIFTRIRSQDVVETGIDIFEEQEGEVSNDDYFKKISGENKRFLGGPTCIIQGIEVPCLTRWSPKGSITSVILIDILVTLDHLKVFNCAEGRKSCLLLDGYESRFELYLIDSLYEWVVCISAPYSTVLWKVGDSSEQNGAYNIVLAKEKN